MSDYQHVLVGIDGSKQSEMALEKAISAALQNNAKLSLLSVINGERFPNTSTVGYGFIDRSVYDGAVKEMEKKLAHYQKQAEDAGVTNVDLKVKIGNAKIELGSKFPEANDVDLIVVGATGLNFIGRMIVGSTASYVVRESPCDVIVVKTDKENKPVDLQKTTYPEI
ncbi:universal stress protein UspA [Paucilactobacillus hokkaidonensis JCM 18461]|uniref:Universal stress protein n=2 Tax=Paucilactobacillus hokkaidonensis TaxID=1193095 RepID=A0A0A1GWD9_9LACO|nr:universal stress protein [Paucilactobacillus hokkaidonensis]BAP85369.1 universal stress protein UspA [Paucilactobacillus hokkaidonensis JCM 18461]